MHFKVKINKTQFKEAVTKHPAKSLAALLNADDPKVAIEVRGNLPKDTTIKRSGQRIRKENIPAVSSCTQDLTLEREWCQVNGEDVIILENTSEVNPCIILSTKANIRYLKQSNV